MDIFPTPGILVYLVVERRVHFIPEAHPPLQALEKKAAAGDVCALLLLLLLLRGRIGGVIQLYFVGKAALAV